MYVSSPATSAKTTNVVATGTRPLLGLWSGGGADAP
jgi:hypothetical protein